MRPLTTQGDQGLAVESNPEVILDFTGPLPLNSGQKAPIGVFRQFFRSQFSRVNTYNLVKIS